MPPRLLPPALRWLPILALAACGNESTPLAIETTDPGVEEPGPIAPSLGRHIGEVEGYPTLGEVRTGFIYDQSGQPAEVSYEIHDGLAVWQGDIVIGTPDQVPTTMAELQSRPRGGPLPGVVTDDTSKRWPGGVVPYTIDSGLASQSRVTTAIQLIEDQTPGVTFVPRTSESDYVTFITGGGCSSSIGMSGGQQFINLASGCTSGNAAHEILHTLGMYHEHTRCDRDNYVTIDYAQVDPSYVFNFYKAGASTQTGDCSGAYDIDTYDPGSMMHYPQYAFAIGSSPTILPKPGVDGSQMGQRDHVGPTDQATIAALYGANNAAPNAVLSPLSPSYPEGSAVPWDASGTNDPDDAESILTYSWSFGDGTCSVSTPPSACSSVSPSHTYADNGTFPVSVTASDGFATGTASTTATITNVAPSVSAGLDAHVDEGSLFSRYGSFTDPGADTWTATVDYGDGGGAAALTLSGKSFSLSHTYVDNGVNTVTVEVTDDDGGVGNDDAVITVDNVVPNVHAGPDVTVNSGETFDFSGTFSDPGIEDAPWGWVIDWGFGTNTSGSTDDQSAAITASRDVCAAGIYTVRLTVTDKDGGAGWDEMSLTVPYIPVGIDVLPGTDGNPVRLRGAGRLPVAILGSPDLDVTQIDPATLTLGDGSGADTPVSQKNNGAYEVYMEDVDGDGTMDLLATFMVNDLVDGGDLTMSSTELVLRGFLTDGCTNIRGTDLVQPIF